MNTDVKVRRLMMWSPYDPYGFFGHLDRDILVVGAFFALLAFVGVLVDKILLTIVALVVGLMVVVVVQAIRNYRRRVHYQYEPQVSNQTN
jgi:Flp pilus assembly protein TadB